MTKTQMPAPHLPADLKRVDDPQSDAHRWLTSAATPQRSPEEVADHAAQIRGIAQKLRLGTAVAEWLISHHFSLREAKLAMVELAEARPTSMTDAPTPIEVDLDSREAQVRMITNLCRKHQRQYLVRRFLAGGYTLEQAARVVARETILNP